MLDSIWTAAAELPSFPRLEQDVKTDVLIIGGGLAGLLCAYALEQRGIDYLLIEADTICSGVSRNTTAKLTSQHGLIYDRLIRTFGKTRAAQYLAANQAALQQYREISRQIDCDFEDKDSFVYATDTPRKLENELKALE